MEKLITDIEDFCSRHGFAETRFGLESLGDKPFVSQLKAGRRVWPETEARIRAFMDTYTTAKAA